MLVPSIDLMNGSAVQLIGGKEMEIDAGDPIVIAERFRLAGEIAVIDLDAALGKGSNRQVIEQLLRIAPCRVGGGIRDVETAIRWLDAGAEKIILGTAAKPEILKQLPRERVIVALDAVHDEVVVDGWRTKTGTRVDELMTELREYVGGFLVTFVEREGRMQGIDLDRVRALCALAGDAQLTVAGGVAEVEEIAAIDALGTDAQVGMALYSGRIHLADAIVAPFIASAPDELWPTVVCDEFDTALGLVWSNRESVRAAVEQQAGVYFSRSRQELWQKGLTSGNTQELFRIALDCDRDALRFTVRQKGDGFCHNNTQTCWGNTKGLAALQQRIQERMQNAVPGSYTRRLLDDPQLLRSKLLEEAGELAEAKLPEDVAHEAADILYFAFTAMVQAGVSLTDVADVLDRRALKVTRRSATETIRKEQSC